MYKFRIKHCLEKFNTALDCASRYSAGIPSENMREDDRASAAQAQQDSIYKSLDTVTVYIAQMINSAIDKATFT